MLEFYRLRAIPGIEEVTADCYRRNTGGGWVEARSMDGGREIELHGPDDSHASDVAARIAGMFDVEANTPGIAEHIGFATAWLPGCWDPFELAVRAILGQQVSVAAARTFAGRIIERCGGGAFPTAESLRRADLNGIGLVRRRAETLRLLAEAVCGGRMDYGFASLTAIPGVGPWTAHYVAMRALKDADAFPASDLVLRKVLSLTEKQLLARAEAWRPYRAYAVIQVWRMSR